VELDAAVRLSRLLGAVDHRVMTVDLAGIGGSALTDPSIAVPVQGGSGIPVTYVPARNTMMLALALGWAEVLGATDLFVGVNAVDYSGYPDCRPEFISAFERLANLATRAGVEGRAFRVHAPLIHWSKARIIEEGLICALDPKAGGDVADNLGGLYEYMCDRLMLANLRNDPAVLEEVRRLLVDLREAWSSLVSAQARQAAEAALEAPARRGAGSYGRV
jgi:queuosine biosynthesis protein QueC